MRLASFLLSVGAFFCFFCASLSCLLPPNYRLLSPNHCLLPPNHRLLPPNERSLLSAIEKVAIKQ